MTRRGVGILALATLAWAADLESLVDEIEKSFKKSVLRPAGWLAKDVVIDALADHPSFARRVCEAAAKASLKAAGKRPDDVREVVRRILQIGARAKQGAPADRDALYAHEHALRLGLRFAQKTGEDTDAARLALVDAIEEVFRSTQDPADLVRAVEELRAAKAPRSEELVAREKALFESGIRDYPAHPFFRAAALRGELERIREVVSNDPRAGKDALEEYVARVGTLLLSSPSDEDCLTLYNDAIDVARGLKRFSLEAEYEVETVTTDSNYLRFSFPKGRRWRFVEDSDDSLGVLSQYDADGILFREFYFDFFEWDVAYVDGGREFGGDNLKGLARLDEGWVTSEFSKVKRTRKPMRGRLNRALPQCMWFEVSGLDEDGDPQRYVLYYWKATKTKMRTFRVMIVEYGDFPELDPQAESVVASIHEPG